MTARQTRGPLQEAIHWAVHWAAYLLAIAGGLALIAMTILTVVSVTGRGFLWAGLGPVPGTYELIEMGAAFAVFAFLPWCQLKRGHVTVDLFLARLGRRARVISELVSNLLISAAAAILFWRLWIGLVDKRSYGETTYILGIPAWYGYAAAAVGAALFVVVSLYSFWRSCRELRDPAGADGDDGSAGEAA